MYSVSLLKQQSAGRYVAPLGHIVMIPIQPIFAFTTVNLPGVVVEDWSFYRFQNYTHFSINIKIIDLRKK